MLIQFSVKNYRSIKDEIELQLTTNSKAELPNNIFKPDAKGANNLGLMKSAVVYGPNAAGKSTLIDALDKMRWLVLFSARALHSTQALDIEPFKFSKNSINKPSEFNADFISEGTRYQYGFSASNNRILEEWLFAYPNGRAQTWFMRKFHKETGEYIWTKDAYLTGAKATWKEATRDNALFLSTAILLNSKQLTPVYKWFDCTLQIIGTHDLNSKYTANQIFNDNNAHDDVLAFLKAGDLAIEDIKVKEDKARQPETNRDAYGNITELSSQLKNLTINTGYRLEDGSMQYLDYKHESDGTQRMFALAAPIIRSLQKGEVVFIDELNNSLHPTMVKFLVSLFNSSEENPNNAQLIFTTHETSILSQEVFRRDQIWFCEKDKSQSTTLYSLSDFKVRKGAENIERNYLSGKYGALPFIKKPNN